MFESPCGVILFEIVGNELLHNDPSWHVLKNLVVLSPLESIQDGVVLLQKTRGYTFTVCRPSKSTKVDVAALCSKLVQSRYA